MTLDEIKDLIAFIREQDLSEFELEQEGVKLRIKSGGAVHHAPTAQAGAMPMPPPSNATGSTPSVPVAMSLASPPNQSEPQDEAEGPQLAIVKSPIVGTFYRSAEPAAKAFVEVGDSVKTGDVLCIIEAMKLMNEIDSEYDGEVVNVYVDNGQAVQYGERLFSIRLK